MLISFIPEDTEHTGSLRGWIGQSDGKITASGLHAQA
jgi:hypothetical protein